MIASKFNPIWYTIPEFAEKRLQSVYRKEQEVQDIVPDSCQNLHVLMKAKMVVDTSSAQKIYLRITADDYYKAYINGSFVGQGPAPAYPEKYYYNEIDVTPYMKQGENQIAVHGYYQGLINRVWNSGDGRFGIASDLVFLEKKEERVLSLKWRYKISDAYTGDWIGYETQFLENFDSRKWDVNWKQMDAEQRPDWQPMVQVSHWKNALYLQPTKMLDVYERYPKIVKRIASNTWFVDAGHEITGSLLMKARGKEGQKIRIFCGEELQEDGQVRYEMRCNCRYEETWTLSEGESILEPYDYKGFRYARIEAEEGVEILEVKLQIRHYPLNEDLCTLETDQPLVNQIFQMCKDTIKFGTQEGYLDCPTREKGQYLGDAIVTSRAQVWLTGSTEMLRKSIDQFAQTVKICPGLMAVAPGSLMQEIGDFSLLFPEFLLTDYAFTGDKHFLEEYYPAAKGMLDYFEKYKAENGLLKQVSEKWNLVDWPENLRDNYDFVLSRPIVSPGCHNVINALYVGAVKSVSKIERILDYPVTRDWKEVKNCFIKAFYRPEKKLFVDSESSGHTAVHSNIYPLYFGLVPEEAVETVAEFLVKKGLCCGVMLSSFLLKGLARAGYYEEVYQLIVNEGIHGWVNMLREGATTCFEAWGKDQKWNTSLCHPWAASPISILIEEIGGVKLEPDSEKGYRLEPHIPVCIEEFKLEIQWLKNRERRGCVWKLEQRHLQEM